LSLSRVWFNVTLNTLQIILRNTLSAIISLGIEPNTLTLLIRKVNLCSTFVDNNATNASQQLTNHALIMHLVNNVFTHMHKARMS